VLLAPAMNVNMWQHAATQANLETLRARPPHRRARQRIPGLRHDRPGPHGRARGHRRRHRSRTAPAAATWKAKHVLITAGPTQEPLDPVRYISNRSSGKMGYALAEAAAARGARVVLISGPVHLSAAARRGSDPGAHRRRNARRR
jgi:phosphopantothenoylcysteine decarboxylase/phosphopantothenate--cysteine ligase